LLSYLGVSYAHGTQHVYSDLDLGVYYTEAASFSIEDIRVVWAGWLGWDVIHTEISTAV